MEWPARSLTLKPIEHVWDTLGKHIAGRPAPLKSVAELDIALKELPNILQEQLYWPSMVITHHIRGLQG